MAFWDWFATIADEFADCFDNQAIQEELDARLARLGEIAWEVGPGTSTENMLAISPDGDPELLPLTRRIVSMAPKLPRWEFLPARPARPPSWEFSIARGSGEQTLIDARSWKYVLFKVQKELFDIVLEQRNLAHVEDGQRYGAAVVLLDSLLGESKRLQRIRDIEPVIALSSEHAKRASPIAVLVKHLDSLA